MPRCDLLFKICLRSGFEQGQTEHGGYSWRSFQGLTSLQKGAETEFQQELAKGTKENCFDQTLPAPESKASRRPERWQNGSRLPLKPSSSEIFAISCSKSVFATFCPSLSGRLFSLPNYSSCAFGNCLRIGSYRVGPSHFIANSSAGFKIGERWRA
jgi:hypothetical protein